MINANTNDMTEVRAFWACLGKSCQHTEARIIFTPQQVSKAIGPKFPIGNVTSNWPLVESALDRRGIYTRACAIAAAATIAVETGSFIPVRERGGPAYFTKLYWDDQAKAKELGNTSSEDAVRYRGRGFVQITGRWNYDHFGKEIHVDLITDPDAALDPDVSADILAVFFRERKVDQAALAGDWEHVRRRVNGGLTGWADFKRYVEALSAVALPSAADLDVVAAEEKARTATS